MKKELIAFIALLFLIAFVSYNVRYISTVTEELSGYIEASQAAYTAADYDTAETQLRHAIDIWSSSGAYTHIALRHSDIDSVTASFYDLLSEVYAQSQQVYGGYENILAELSHLAEMETPHIGSIF